MSRRPRQSVDQLPLPALLSLAASGSLPAPPRDVAPARGSDALLDALRGSQDVLALTRRTFALVEIAEEQLSRFFPGPRSSQPAGLFAALCPPRIISRYGSDVLYQAHAVELISRAKNEEPLGPGTDAEVLLALSLGSLRAPLSSGYQATYEQVFHRRLPLSWARAFGSGEAPSKGDWPGQVREIFAPLARKMGDLR